MILTESALQTVTFLQQLPCGAVIDGSVLSELAQALQQDGIDIVQTAVTDTHHLRRLSESFGDNFIADLLLVFMCVTFAGFASGLTQGLLSLDYMEMKIKAVSGTPKEKEYASKVLPIISHHHLLLVTLMLWNATATEALPIFLSGMVSEYVAIIISVTLVLLFGEIIPASILTGPKQLQIAASLIPLVYFVFIIFFPIAYPIAKLLDYIIGHDEGFTMYSRREIVTMMTLQHEEGIRRASMIGKNSSFSVRDTMVRDEVAIIGGALKFRDMKVSEVMTHDKSCFMISVHEVLSFKTMYDIFKSGYSRIPVFDTDRNDVVGLILAKDLIFVDPEDEIPIENFIALFGRKPMFVWHDQLLGETLAGFRQERAHMAVVRDVRSEGGGDPYYVVVGLITLEDIIEEILGTEIEDETDAAAYSTLPNATLSAATSALRDMDLARFKALRSKITDESLSEDEVHVIASFLFQQVPEMQQLLQQHGVVMHTPALSMDSAATISKQGMADLLAANTEINRSRQVSSANPMHTDSMGPMMSNSVSMEGMSMKPITSDTQYSQHAGTDGMGLLESIVRKATVYNMKRQSPPGTPADKPHQDDVLYRRGKLSNTCILILQGRVRVLRGQYEDPVIVGAWSTLGAQALIVTEGTYVPDFTAYIDSEMLRFIRISTFQSDGGHRHGELRRRKSAIIRTPTQQSDASREETPTRRPSGNLFSMLSPFPKASKGSEQISTPLLAHDVVKEEHERISSSKDASHARTNVRSRDSKSVDSKSGNYAPPELRSMVGGDDEEQGLTRRVTFHGEGV